MSNSLMFCGVAVSGDRSGPAEACGKPLPCSAHPSVAEWSRICHSVGCNRLAAPRHLWCCAPCPDSHVAECDARQPAEPATTRLETGLFTPSPTDWPGVFIRGDEAAHYAQTIRAAFQYGLDGLIGDTIQTLGELLESCVERSEPEPTTADSEASPQVETKKCRCRRVDHCHRADTCDGYGGPCPCQQNADASDGYCTACRIARASGAETTATDPPPDSLAPKPVPDCGHDECSVNGCKREGSPARKATCADCGAVSDHDDHDVRTEGGHDFVPDSPARKAAERILCEDDHDHWRHLSSCEQQADVVERIIAEAYAPLYVELRENVARGDGSQTGVSDTVSDSPLGASIRITTTPHREYVTVIYDFREQKMAAIRERLKKLFRR